MTLLTLRTTVRDILNEATASFWSDVTINEALNEAQRVTAILAKCIEKTAAVNTATGVRRVSFADAHIEDVEYNGKALTRIKPKQIGTMPETTADLGHFFEFDEKAMIEPIPGAIVPLVLYTIGEPTLMSADGNSPSTPLCYDLALIYYAVAYCWLLEKNYAGYGFMLALYHDEVATVTSIALSKVVDSYADLKGEK
jgi:hypothetical protein